MKIDITEEQINQLLEDVKQEFIVLQKSEAEEAEKLAKAEDKPKEEKEAPAEPAADAPSAPEAPAEAAPEAPAEAPPAQEDPVAQAGVGPDELCDMYSNLSDEDLSMHYMAASKALFSRMSGDQEVEEEAPEMPPQEAQDAGAPPPADAPPMAKSEPEISDEVIEAFEKLEQENKVIKEESEALKKKLDELADTMSKMIAKPVKSGFVSGSVIESVPEAPKPMTQKEVIEKLNKKAQDPSLTNDKREQLIKFSLNPVLTEELVKFLDDNK